MTKLAGLIKSGPGILMAVGPLVDLATTWLEQTKYREAEETKRYDISSRERIALAELAAVCNRFKRTSELHAEERMMVLPQLTVLLEAAVREGNAEMSRQLLDAIQKMLELPYTSQGEYL